ncbi:hypothetical protein F4818DRAFT_445282 [Hypoxylon cercidicola]|nr:hypothetical protein F4818DRAFT_445282 [Hypoxylon cercidicola]
MDQNRNKPIRDERSHLSKPQIFVQLAFGVSWTQGHTPQTHTLTYMSRNLKSSRNSGNFPRQVPAPNTNFLDVPEQQQQCQHRSREHAGRHYQHRQQNRPHHHSQPSHALTQSREHGRSRAQTNDQPSEQLRARPRRGSRSEARGTLHERGRSAPPPFNDSPWDVHHASGSTVFPYRGGGEPSQASKALPAPPSQYRLGEDGLPWSAWAWPADAPDRPDDNDGDGDEMPYANNPTTVPLSTERLCEDPERVRELESLSTAMMTVDNGFEGQWWYQGPRESVETWWPQEAEDEETQDAGTLTTAEALLLSNSEPPSAIEYSNEPLASLHDMVSPMSDTSSPTRSFRGPLYRSMTTRSEELWLGR